MKTKVIMFLMVLFVFVSLTTFLRSKKMRIKIILVLLLVGGACVLGGREAKASLYNFTSSPEAYCMTFMEIVDGVNINGIEDIYVQGTAQSVWDVDAENMQTTFYEMHTQATPVIKSRTFTIQGGFGEEDFEVPYTFAIDKCTSDITQTFGPYPIEANLMFDREIYLAGNMNMNLKGHIDIEGQIVSYDISTFANWGHGSAGKGQFDDSDYPNQLGLDLGIGYNFNWGSNVNYSIFSMDIEGHQIEFLVQAGYINANNWHGIIIPEPSTWVLLICGLITFLILGDQIFFFRRK